MAIAIDKIGGNYALPANSIKICFMQNISAMKTVQISTIFLKNEKKKNRKMNNFGS